jgi:hypothetical protein
MRKLTRDRVAAGAAVVVAAAALAAGTAAYPGPGRRDGAGR